MTMSHNSSSSSSAATENASRTSSFASIMREKFVRFRVHIDCFVAGRSRDSVDYGDDTSAYTSASSNKENYHFEAVNSDLVVATPGARSLQLKVNGSLYTTPAKSSSARHRNGVKCECKSSNGEEIDGSHLASNRRAKQVESDRNTANGIRQIAADRSSQTKKDCKNECVNYEDFVSGLSLEVPQKIRRKRALPSTLLSSNCGDESATGKREMRPTACSFASSDSAAEPEVRTNFRSLAATVAHDRKSTNRNRHSATAAVRRDCKNLRLPNAMWFDVDDATAGSSCNKETLAERQSTKADNFRQSGGGYLGLLKAETRMRSNDAPPAGRRVALSAECDRVTPVRRKCDRRPSFGCRRLAATSKVNYNSN